MSHTHGINVGTINGSCSRWESCKSISTCILVGAEPAADSAVLSSFDREGCLITFNLFARLVSLVYCSLIIIIIVEKVYSTLVVRTVLNLLSHAYIIQQTQLQETVNASLRGNKYFCMGQKTLRMYVLILKYVWS